MYLNLTFVRTMLVGCRKFCDYLIFVGCRIFCDSLSSILSWRIFCDNWSQLFLQSIIDMLTYGFNITIKQHSHLVAVKPHRFVLYFNL